MIRLCVSIEALRSVVEKLQKKHLNWIVSYLGEVLGLWAW